MESLLTEAEAEALTSKYFDPSSEQYIFKTREYEFKKRNSGNKDVPYEQTVGAKKLKFLNQYFSDEGELKLDLADKDAKFFSQLLENIVDMNCCTHFERAHRARHMCHSCYHGRGNQLKAWKCSHTDMPHHSSGLCKVCYHQHYYKHKIHNAKPKKNKANKAKLVKRKNI